MSKKEKKERRQAIKKMAKKMGWKRKNLVWGKGDVLLHKGEKI